MGDSCFLSLQGVGCAPGRVATFTVTEPAMVASAAYVVEGLEVTASVARSMAVSSTTGPATSAAVATVVEAAVGWVVPLEIP